MCYNYDNMVFYDEFGKYMIGGELGLHTRMGRQIPNERRPEKHPDSMQAARETVEGNHPTAKLRSLTASYNCMGMVFASRRTWIEPDYLQMVLDDDEYQRVTSEDNITPGDVVVYKDDSREVTHVGLIADVKPELRNGTYKITVLSQWGQHGEYFHRIDDVHPLLGTPSEYWTDRR
jgi:hypothetical protein